MNGIVIRLAGVPQPETKVFHQPVITIGTTAECDLKLSNDEAPLPPAAVLVTLQLTEGVYRVASLAAEAGLTRDGEPVAINDAIHDGDTFYFGATGIRLRVFALSEAAELTDSLRLGTAVLARVRPARRRLALTKSQPRQPQAPNNQLDKPAEQQANNQAVAVPRTDVALVFVKQLARELAAEIPRRWLYLAAGIVGLLIVSFLYANVLSFWQGRRNNEAIGELNQSLDETKQQLGKLSEELKKQRELSDSMRSSISFASRVVENYGSSVCLIYGAYTYFDPRAGREARFREMGDTNNPINPNGGLNLSAEGNGRIYEIEFMGTGFLVEKGMILTNRHVLQPWDDDPVNSVIRAQGFRPRLKELFTYFPKSPQPLALKQVEVSTERDVALCMFEGELNLPVLPLDETGEGAVRGESVVLIGYPAGLEGLFARVDDRDRWGLSRLSIRSALNELALRGQIRPQSTQGHIGDLTPRQLVYDAQTGEGGSGGPVFGSNGKVIGVNQAVMPNTPSNFGVPIRYGLELLLKHKALARAKSEKLSGTQE